MRFTRLWLIALLLGAATASAQVARLPSLKMPLLDIPDVTPQQVQQADDKLVSRLLEFLA